MANVFIHFYPVSEIEEAISSSGDDHQIELPLYILEGSAEADHWRNSAQGVLVDTSVDENGYTHAHKAADKGDISILNFILKKNPPALHLGDANGWQPIHFAVRSGRVEVVKFLVENAGADVNYRTNDGTGKTALELALSDLPIDDELIVYLYSVSENFLVERLPDDTSVDESGYTHAHRAADEGDIKALYYILKMNSPALRLGDVNGWQPLHFAIRSGRVEAVKFLVENAGADILYRTNDGTGQTALQLAREYFPSDELTHYLHSVRENLLDGDFSASDEL
jgi:ankyrin repeat protein